MNTYTVIGIYSDNHQRYASVVEADSVEEAEEAVLDAVTDLIIAGIIEGDVPVIG